MASNQAPRYLRLALLLILCLGWARVSIHAAVAQHSGYRYAARLNGRFVAFDGVGFEPDGDPVDRVIASATLREAAATQPPSTLVLSLYLENFQPRTSPDLPDLLQPTQPATNLAGFMQGKAELVNHAGKVSYWGSALAETFFDNSVHLLLSLHEEGAPDTAPDLRLLGSFTVGSGFAMRGTLSAQRTLSTAEARHLHAPHAPTNAVRWQQIVSSMVVRRPAMMGAAVAPSSATVSQPSAAPGAPQAVRSALTSAVTTAGPRPTAAISAGSAGAVGLFTALLALFAFRVLRRRKGLLGAGARPLRYADNA